MKDNDVFEHLNFLYFYYRTNYFYKIKHLKFQVAYEKQRYSVKMYLLLITLSVKLKIFMYIKLLILLLKCS